MMRDVHCVDAMEWMAGRSDIGAVVTSVPDAEEIGRPIAEWLPWFTDAATACMSIASLVSVAIFYQTDRKFDGTLVSKAGLLFEAQRRTNLKLLWHKIVLRRDPGAVDLRRPGYSHLLAFSKSGKPGQATADVLNVSSTAYQNGMGLRAALFAVDFARHSASVIFDPFCGRGTVLAAADYRGLDSIGVDIDPAQVAIARRLRIEPSSHGQNATV